MIPTVAEPALLRAPHRVREAARVATKIGAVMAAVTLARVIAAFIGGNAPPQYLVESPLLGFVVFFVAAFALLITGAVRVDGRQLLVNPWFAWMVIGAFVVFIVTLLILGHPVIMPPHVVEWSGVAAAGWVATVVLVWAAARAFGHRPAAAASGTPQHIRGANFARASAVSRRSDRILGGGLVLTAVICIGSTLGRSRPWTSTETRLVLMSASLAGWGVTMLARSRR